MSIDEFQTLKQALIQADEQLTLSENQLENLRTQLGKSEELVTELRSQSQTLSLQLDRQNAQLETLTTQLDGAWTSLSRLKNATTFERVIMWVTAGVCLVVGGVIGYNIGGLR